MLMCRDVSWICIDEVFVIVRNLAKNELLLIFCTKGKREGLSLEYQRFWLK
jgi:hypothetical protein